MSLTRGQHKALKEEFLTLLRSTSREGMDKLIDYLEHRTNFFNSPARVENGCAYPGGLLEHSLDVYHILKDKLTPGNPVWDRVLADPAVTEDTIKIVSLLHDVGKCGLYDNTQVNRKTYEAEKVSAAPKSSVKHDSGGDFVWETVQGYRYTNNSPFGIGERSVIMVVPYIALTDMEMNAIGCHRGYTDAKCASSMSDMFAREPLTLAVYEADMEATFIDEKDKLRT